MKIVVLDTDTLSFFFRNHPLVVKYFSDYLLEHNNVCISVITYYEVLNGLYFKDAKKQLEKFEAFISANRLLPFNEPVARKAASIYATLRLNGKAIGHNDVLIAATAMVNEIQLITNNTAHFKNIEGLDYANWMEEKEL